MRILAKGVRAKIRALRLLSVPRPMNLVINGESREMVAGLSDYDYVVLTKNKVGA